MTRPRASRIECSRHHPFVEGSYKLVPRKSGFYRQCLICLNDEVQRRARSARQRKSTERANNRPITSYEYQEWFDDDGHALVKVTPEFFETAELFSRERAARRRIESVLIQNGVPASAVPRLRQLDELESLRVYDYANPDWIVSTTYRTVYPVLVEAEQEESA